MLHMSAFCFVIDNEFKKQRVKELKKKLEKTSCNFTELTKF